MKTNMQNFLHNQTTQPLLDCPMNGAIIMTSLGYMTFPIHGIRQNGACTCRNDANCPDAGKHPIFNGWKENYFMNEFEIRDHWKKHPDSNYGINTKGLVVIDCDERNRGYESYVKILEPHIKDLNTLHVKTGSGGNSIHIYCKSENEVVGNQTGFLPGIDIKGNGGFVVGPGSRHKSGNNYEILKGLSEKEKLAQIPETLVKILNLNGKSEKLDKILSSNEVKKTVSSVKNLANFQKFVRRISHAEGSRSHNLTAICREGLALGISEDDIRSEFQRFVYGDFTMEEAERVFSAQQRYHSEKAFVSFSEEACEGMTNHEIAKLVIHSCRDPFTGDVTLSLVDGEFYKYESGIYNIINEKKFLPELLNKLNKIPGFSASTHKAKEVLAHIKSEVVYHGNAINNFFFGSTSADRFIAFESTVLNMTKLFDNVVEQVQLTPNFFTTAKLPFEYNKSAACPTFMKVLDRILPDKNDQRMLQNWFGYHLMGTIAYGKLLILMGSGANGKSVVLKLLRLFLGENNISSVPLENFSNQSRFAVAETHGKLGNIYDEMSSNRIDESYVKNYVTGGRVQCEHKYEHPFSFTPTAKLTFSTNVMPEINDRSDGFWRRAMILKFNQTIPTHEQNPRYMEDDFWLSSGELAGVFNWALQGAKDISANNSIYESLNAKTALATTRIESDNVRLWISENLTFETGAFLDRTAAYELYKLNAINQSLKPCTNNVFFEEISKSFPKAVVQRDAISQGLRRVRGFHNIKLITTDTGIL